MTLTDFGLSRVMSGTFAIGTKTMMAGTPGFQPPEQLKAQQIGPACDVFAFGCVLIVLYTERVLWPGLTPFQIMVKLTVEDVKPDTRELPVDMRQVCTRCTSDVAGRPSMVEILQELLRMCAKLN